MTPEQLRRALTEVAADAAELGLLPDEAQAGPPAGPIFRPVDPRDAGVVADWATPVVVPWSRALRLEPLDLAGVLARGLAERREIEAVELSPAGWLSITVSDASRSEVIGRVLDDPDGYGVPAGTAPPPVPDERPGSRSPEDPVAVIQRAHALECRQIRNAAAAGVQIRPGDRREQLTHVSERLLLVALADHPQRVLRHAGDRDGLLRAVGIVAERAVAWTHPVRPLLIGERPTGIHGARLSLAVATGHVLRTGLALLGASAPERM
jgi:arginyl-tRNA synthetase